MPNKNSKINILKATKNSIVRREKVFTNIFRVGDHVKISFFYFGFYNLKFCRPTEILRM